MLNYVFHKCLVAVLNLTVKVKRKIERFIKRQKLK